MRKEPTTEPHIRLRFSEYAVLAKVGSNAVLLYLTILKWSYGGYCSKSFNFLAREADLCQKTVSELIKKFVYLKILKKLPTANGERNEYELLDFATATQEQPDEQSEKIHTNRPDKKQPANAKTAATAAIRKRTERARATGDDRQDNPEITQDCRTARNVRIRVG